MMRTGIVGILFLVTPATAGSSVSHVSCMGPTSQQYNYELGTQYLSYEDTGIANIDYTYPSGPAHQVSCGAHWGQAGIINSTMLIYYSDQNSDSTYGDLSCSPTATDAAGNVFVGATAYSCTTLAGGCSSASPSAVLNGFLAIYGPTSGVWWNLIAVCTLPGEQYVDPVTLSKSHILNVITQ